MKTYKRISAVHKVIPTSAIAQTYMYLYLIDHKDKMVAFKVIGDKNHTFVITEGINFYFINLHSTKDYKLGNPVSFPDQIQLKHMSRKYSTSFEV